MRNYRVIFLVVILALSGLMVLVAQDAEDRQQRRLAITGKVVDKDNLPIPFVNISEKGTRRGVVSDVNGVYEIRVRDENSVLVFSFLGMKTKEETVGRKTKIDVVLEEMTVGIEDVVVIGYGSVRKSDLTGAITSIKAEELEDRVVVSIEDALKGRVAGMNITSVDGMPGEGENIVIRGVGSINASNSPLYVIDGVPTENPIINASEIESVEVLKDAASTAIYGSKGANGIIMITTKKGVKGRTRITFTSSVGVQSPASKIPVLGSSDYKHLQFDRANTTFFERGSSAYNPVADRLHFVDSEGNYYTWNHNSPNYNWERFGHSDSIHTDWQDVMMRNAIITDYRLSFSGGSDIHNYNIMASYLRQDGIIVNSGFERYNFRANNRYNLSKTTRLTANISGSYSYQNGLASNETAGVTMNMLAQQPTKKFTDNEWIALDGEDVFTNNNPYLQALRITKDYYKYNLSANAIYEWDMNKYFTFRTSFNAGLGYRQNEFYYPKETGQGRTDNGVLNLSSSFSSSWLNENTLSYKNTFNGSHFVDGVVGVTFEENNRKSLDVVNTNFTIESLGVNNIGQGIAPKIPSSGIVTDRMASVLSRINYNYNGRYYASASMRADGSSRFGAGNKWGYFPSGSLAWRLSEEAFMKEVYYISNIKFRASVGASGNTAIRQYQSLSSFDVSSYPMDGYYLDYGVTLSRIENPNLRWETTIQQNYGIDFGFNKNRYTLSIDYYDRFTKDLLYSVDVPYYSGLANRLANIGNIRNNGLEITLSADILRRKDFGWDISYNMAFNRSKVLELGERGEEILNPSIHASLKDFGLLREGESIGLWYGYQTEGVWKTLSEIKSSNMLSQFTNPIIPGDTKFIDQNNDGLIDENDRVILGKGEPVFIGGLVNNFKYKDFALNFALQFSYGGKLFNATREILEEMRAVNNQYLTVKDRFRPNLYDRDVYDSTGELVLLKEGNENASLRRAGGNAEAYLTDRYLEDGSFLRLSDITLSYQIPSKNLKKVKSLSSFKVYVSVKNAFILTNYMGYDPDVSVAKGTLSNLLPGLDYGSYPKARVVSGGLNVSF